MGDFLPQLVDASHFFLPVAHGLAVCIQQLLLLFLPGLFLVVRQLLPLLLRYRLGFFPRFELVQGLDLSSNTSNIQSLRRLRLVDRRRRRTNTLAGHYLVRFELFRL